MSSRIPIVVVQGAQYGSESKGMVAAALCERRRIDFAVRTGAVNAGHCVYKHGLKYVNQQLPTGWVNPGTNLVIGPGALVHPEILKSEIEMITEAGWDGMIFIDRRAGLHLPEHTERSGRSGRHYRMGATGKGCSEAIIDRLRNRGISPEAGPRTFAEWLKGNWQESWMEKFVLGDTAKMLNDAYDRGDKILIEGCQGTLLDLCLGPYPFVTHKQTTAAQWVVEAGLSPALEYEIVLVARTYPIRVAGNSGPLPDEIDWPTLAKEINDKRVAAGMGPIVTEDAIMAFEAAYHKLEGTYHDPVIEMSERNRDALANLPQFVVDELKKLFEFTTVTKKLRRVARLNLDELRYSVMINRPAWLCLTFMNYEYPELWGQPLPKSDHPCYEWLDSIQEQLEVDIKAITTGPESKHFDTCG